MSKIKNSGLDQYGAGPFEQQQFGTAGVEGVKTFDNIPDEFVTLIGNTIMIYKKENAVFSLFQPPCILRFEIRTCCRISKKRIVIDVGLMQTNHIQWTMWVSENWVQLTIHSQSEVHIVFSSAGWTIHISWPTCCLSVCHDVKSSQVY